MKQYAYPWDDEVMADVRARKAQLLENYGGFDGLNKHIDEERPQLEAEGWKFLDPQKFREQNMRRQMTALN